MAEGEHTIISKIPRERLNQIAGRKLAALGIPVRLAADRETLEGDLAFASRIANPLSGVAMTRARFVVVGHDQLRFVEPPLSALAPVPFYDVERTSALEARIAELLGTRAAVLEDLAARMRALGIEPRFEPDRLLVRAVVKTASQAFELLGEPEGVRISRVAPVGGKPFDVPAAFQLVRLDEHATLSDLELWLEELASKMRSGPQQGGARPVEVREAARIEVTPPPRNALTLGQIVQAFGAGGVMAPNAPVEVFQEFKWAGTHYRFVATREMGDLFRGRLIGPSGDVWSDKFDLPHFPGILKVVASALGAAGAESEALPLARSGEGEPVEVPQHLMPHEGEVWVMSVVVEQAGEEVRYVGTDIDGRPYGAARVLKRTDFEAVFSRERNGWRLLILIDKVQEGSVFYRQLDPQRQPVGAPRKMAVTVLVANFVPEAAAF